MAGSTATPQDTANMLAEIRQMNQGFRPDPSKGNPDAKTPFSNPVDWNTYIPETKGGDPKNVGLPLSRVPIGALPNLGALFGNRQPNVTGSQQEPGAGAYSGSQDSELQQMIRSINQPLDPNIIAQGMTPVPGGRATTIPQQMQQPLAPFQQRPYNENPVVGAGNARARGIENAFTGVANAIGSVTAAKAQQLHNRISVATERLMQSQQAIDQASMALRTAPPGSQAAKDAQDVINKNKTIMSTLLSDDKVRKGIEKGMDISFTDPSKNKTPEHGAVAAARQSFEGASKNNFAEQFSRQLPQQMQIDPVAQQRMQLALQQKAMDQKLMSTMLPKILASKDAMERTRYVQGMINQRQISQQQFRAAQFVQQFKNNVYMKGLAHTYKLDEAYKTIAWTGQKIMELHQADKLDPSTIFMEKNKFTQNMLGEESKYQAAISKVQGDIQAGQIALGSTKGDKDAIRANIQQAQYQLQGLQMAYQNIQKEKAQVYQQFGAMEAYSKGDYGGTYAPGAASTGEPGPADGGDGSSGTPYDERAYGFGLQLFGTPPGGEPSTDSGDNPDDANAE